MHTSKIGQMITKKTQFEVHKEEKVTCYTIQVAFIHYLETCSIASMKKTSFISLEELMLKSSRYCAPRRHECVRFSGT